MGKDAGSTFRVGLNSSTRLPAHRYLKDLPPGLSEFNDSCLRKQKARQAAQNKQAIAAIVNEAKHRANQLPLNAAYADDAYDFMTDEAMAEQPST